MIVLISFIFLIVISVLVWIDMEKQLKNIVDEEDL